MDTTTSSCSFARAAAVAFRMAVVLAAPAASRTAHATPAIPVRTVESPRLTVADVLPAVEGDVRDIDLGASPPPGSSRVVKREEVVAALPAGQRGADRIPPAVRVVRASTTLPPAAIESMVRAASPGRLPKGAVLVAVRARAAALVPRGWDEVELSCARTPRRPGRHATTATVRLRRAGTVVATLVVPVDLQLPATAAVPDVRRGATMEITAGAGPVEVRAPARANEDADVGDVLQVTVEGSGKVLRARLVRGDPPRGVVEP